MASVAVPLSSRVLACRPGSRRPLTCINSSRKKQQQKGQTTAAPEPTPAPAPAPAPVPAPAPSTTASSSPEPPAAPYRREWVAFSGDKVVETNENFKGPEDEKDLFEGESWETFGKVVQTWFVPGLILFGIVVGSYAANTYNEGATAYVAPPNPNNSNIEIIPAEAFAAPPLQ